MATRKQPTNFIISPSELKVYKDSTEPVELSIFNCYEFFVQCNGKQEKIKLFSHIINEYFSSDLEHKQFCCEKEQNDYWPSISC
jgi:hypothetical protein